MQPIQKNRLPLLLSEASTSRAGIAKKFICGVLLATAAASPYAQHSVNGTVLMSWINNGYQQNNVSSGILLGFVMGVVESNYERWSKAKSACITESTTPGQIEDATVRYLRDRPRDMSLPGSTLVAAAMQQSFPCRK